MTRVMATLTNAPAFQEFSPDEIGLIAEIGKSKSVRQGRQIIQEGETGRSLFVVASGSVEVVKHVQGPDAPAISRLGAGAIFGEFGLIGHPPRTADVVACEDMEVIEIEYGPLEALARSRPQIGAKLYRALAASVCSKLTQTNEALLQFFLSSRHLALGRMAMSIVHEINNPLSTLQLNLSMAKDLVSEGVGVNESATRDLLNMIDVSYAVTERIAAIIRGVRLAGRDSRNDPKVKVSLRDVLSDTLEFCNQRVRKSSVVLRLPETKDDVEIECRPVQLSQVLINLVNNSYDAVRDLENKWISVEARNFEDRVEITVTDSGPGIPKSIVNKLFEPFFTTKPAGSGTGLGLSISRKLIESHAGVLMLDTSCPNTRFVIQLPKSKA